MDKPTHAVPLRSARDRLIDLLAIGDSYPITDLNVVADQLKVPFGGTARIPIEDAQEGVVYQLCDPRGQPLGDAFKAAGHGGTLVMDTPRVMEDVTYRIRATKPPSGGTLPPQPSRWLDERAPVKVGLDTSLVIEITDAWMPDEPVPTPVPLLDPDNAHPKPSDARLVPSGASVDIRVNNSQEGVQYSLIIDGVDVKQPVVTGDLAAIVLRTPPMQEDAVIQVRATKTFPATENRTAETRPLDAKLYLKVRASQALAVSVDASIVGYGTGAAVRVAGAQRSVTYRAYARAIRDREFVRGETTGLDVVSVPVDGKPPVQVSVDVPSEIWRTPEGFEPIGDAPVPGNGGTLVLPLRALVDDTVVLVQASKAHQRDATGAVVGSIPSAVRVRQAAVVLVRPDPARLLTLRVPIAEGRTGDTLQVSGGQPGVFYYLRPAPAGVEFPLPAYFHKRDDRESSQNKGVGQLGIEIDLAVATDPDVTDRGNLGPASVFPRAPLVSLTPVAADASLAVRAVKAQTGVEIPLGDVAVIRPVPVIRADPSLVDFSAVTRLVIAGSDAADQYQALRSGLPLAPAQPGTGADVTVAVTDPFVADATLDVVVTRPVDKGLRVERVGSARVRVRPTVALPVVARAETVVKDAATEIVVQQTQTAVNYHLMVEQVTIGPAVPGNGASIGLPTGPVSANTTFSVVASRADDAAVTVVLTTRATVTVSPGP